MRWKDPIKNLGQREEEITGHNGRNDDGENPPFWDGVHMRKNRDDGF